MVTAAKLYRAVVLRSAALQGLRCDRGAMAPGHPADRLARSICWLGGTAFFVSTISVLLWPFYAGAYDPFLFPSLSAAAALGGCAAALLLSYPALSRPWRRRAGRWAAAFAATVALVNALAHAGGFTISPWLLMPLGTISLTLLLAAAVGLLNSRQLALAALSQLAAWLGFLLALFVFTGYLYGQEILFHLGAYRPVALPVAVSGLLVAVGTILAEPVYGPTRRIRSQTTGGKVLWRLSVPTIVLPVAILWLVYQGEAQGWYNHIFAFSLASVLLIVAIAALLIRQAALMDQAEIAARAQRRQLARTVADYEQLVESVADSAIYMLDARGDITSWNRGAQAMSGYRPAEVLGVPFSRFCSAGVLATDPVRLLDQARRDGHAVSEGWCRKRNGRAYYVLTGMTALRDDDGSVRGFAVVTRDITDRREAEQAVRESERRLELAVEAAELYLWQYDPASDEFRQEERIEIALGYAPGELGHSLEWWLGFVHPEDYQRDYPLWRAFLRGETAFFLAEFRIRHKQGQWRWLQSRAKVTEWGEQGTPAKVMGVMLDITERKEAELTLRATEAKLQLAANISGLGVWEWNRQTDEIYFSPEWRRQLGCNEQDLPNRMDAWLSRLHPDDRERVIERLRRCRWGPEPPFELEYRIRHRDGAYRWIALRGLGIIDETTGSVIRVTGTAVDVTERKRHEQRIRHESQRDKLTGLLNRVLLDEFAGPLLATARRNGGRIAVLFVDMDRFKPINDTYGHDAGDAVLKEVAQRLSDSVRRGDLVGRIGGDEFVVVLSQVQTDEDIAKVAQHCVDNLALPYRFGAHELYTSSSVGISVYPRDGQDIDALITCADRAMYIAKKSGRNRFRFFTEQANQALEDTLKLRRSIHEAIDRRELALFYQPVVDLDVGKLLGVEALLRWPGSGLAPDVFLPVAEKAELMPALGAWVMKEACRQQGVWRKQGMPAFPVSVNLSVAELQTPQVMERLQESLRANGLAPGDLQLEVNESAVIQAPPEVRQTLAAVRATGVKIVLDRAGPASLDQLGDLPVDILKVDRALIRRLGDDVGSLAVADALSAFATARQLELIAEGVETAEVAERLRQRHWHRSQGFHFGKPMPPSEFEQWVAQRAA
ncbi:hypothetical protein CAI21_15955 [Alkalilimnicola ehrlichii]|uniref:Diguanylate cyclase/phosphodiesterase with PAS/PAC sensor(S) n=2 Tax=Alkalilimnicola ehrlichii TaxID=351052 RepID=A0A3E0WLP3_9GAMM|nr:hypothetical protein CAI21_15955 [Alkalilimnicola ehrlichii]RFA33874.1 hypothetical protein CAL65_16080 [Alkalilimnicola ehrlichii]